VLSAREEQVLNMIEQQLVFESPRWALRFDKLKKKSGKGKRGHGKEAS